MGHTHIGSVRNCLARCTFDGVAPQIVMTVREPYSYYRSLFTYAWACAYSAVCIPAGVDDFAGFMEWVNNNRHVTQIRAIDRACGQPCHVDHLLRTEHLGTDWLRLMEHLSLPLSPLPWSNPTKRTGTNAGPPPPTLYTVRVVEIIDNIDARIFSEYGYRQRQAPFQL